MERARSDKITIIPLWEKTSFQNGHLTGEISLNFSEGASFYRIPVKKCPGDKKYTNLTITRTRSFEKTSSLTGLKATVSQVSKLGLQITGYSLLPDETISILSFHPCYMKPISHITLSPLIDPIPGSKYYLVFSSSEDGSIGAVFKKIPETATSSYDT
ncbi:MAG: hypothetical protein FJZ59_07465 [Chlamydiae bacterium]|nr:hypothetical protein [Chlamydiota bacterium]